MVCVYVYFDPEITNPFVWHNTEVTYLNTVDYLYLLC